MSIQQSSYYPALTTPNDVVGSSAVTATGSSVARTLSNRFADVVNVKDFGAVGDGVVDDGPAIRAALYYAATLPSSVVNFPAGNYNINTFDDGTTSFVKSSGSPAVVKFGCRLTTTTKRKMRWVGDSATISSPLWIDSSDTYPLAAYVILFQIYGQWDFEMEGIDFRSLFGGQGQRPLKCESTLGWGTIGGAQSSAQYAFVSFGYGTPTNEVPSNVKIHHCKFYDFSQAVNCWSGKHVDIRKCHFELTWGVLSSGGTHVDWVAGVGCRYGVDEIKFCDNVFIAGPTDFTPVISQATSGTYVVIRTADNAILNAGAKVSTISGNYVYRCAYEAIATGEIGAIVKNDNLHTITGNVVDGSVPTGANWKEYGFGGNDGIVLFSPNGVVANNSIREAAIGIWLANSFANTLAGSPTTSPNNCVVSDNVIQMATNQSLRASFGISVGGLAPNNRVIISDNLIVAPLLQPYYFNGELVQWDGKVGTLTGNVVSYAAMVLQGSVNTRNITVKGNSMYLLEKADSSFFYGAIVADAECDFVDNYVDGWDFVFWRTGGGTTMRTCKGLHTRNIKRICSGAIAEAAEGIHFYDVISEFSPTQTGWYKCFTGARRGSSVPLNISVSGDQSYGDTTSVETFGQHTRLILGTNNRWDVDAGEMISQQSHQVWNAPVIDRVGVRIGYGHEINAYVHVNKIATKFALAFSGGGGANAAGYASTLINATGLSSTNTITTLVPHQFVNGDKIRFTELTGGSSLVIGADYYVINAAESTLQIASSAGGSVLLFGSDITGSTLTSTNGSLQSVEITNSGSGYSSPPTITVLYERSLTDVTSRFYRIYGSGAQFSGVVSSGVISNISITNGGIGYSGTIRFESGAMAEVANSHAIWGVNDQPVSEPGALKILLKPNETFAISSGTSGANPRGTGTIQVGSGVPSSVPQFIGQQYFDSSSSRHYIADGSTSSANWRALEYV